MSDTTSGFPAFFFFRLQSRQNRGKLRHHREEGLDWKKILHCTSSWTPACTHRRLEPKKAPRRLTDAWESATIKAQKGYCR